MVGQDLHFRYRPLLDPRSGDWESSVHTSDTDIVSFGLSNLSAGTQYEAEASLAADFSDPLTETFQTLNDPNPGTFALHSSHDIPVALAITPFGFLVWDVNRLATGAVPRVSRLFVYTRGGDFVRSYRLDNDRRQVQDMAYDKATRRLWISVSAGSSTASETTRTGYYIQFNEDNTINVNSAGRIEEQSATVTTKRYIQAWFRAGPSWAFAFDSSDQKIWATSPDNRGSSGSQSAVAADTQIDATKVIYGRTRVATTITNANFNQVWEWVSGTDAVGRPGTKLFDITYADAVGLAVSDDGERIFILDQTTKTVYAHTRSGVLVAGSNILPVRLISLNAGGRQVSGFDPTVTTYDLNLRVTRFEGQQTDTAEIRVAGFVADTINHSVSYDPSQSQTFRSGQRKTFRVIVTDGVVSTTYTLNITVTITVFVDPLPPQPPQPPAATAPTLRSLSVAGMTLSPAFSPSVRSYTASAPDGSDFATVTVNGSFGPNTEGRTSPAFTRGSYIVLRFNGGGPDQYTIFGQAINVGAVLRRPGTLGDFQFIAINVENTESGETGEYAIYF